jgi:hypothetical protein
MRTSSGVRIGSLIVFAALAAACETSTTPDPGPEFDGDATLSAYETVDSVLASPTLASFQLLSGRTPLGAAPAALAALSGSSPVAVSDGGRGFALGLARRLGRVQAGAGGPAAAAVISEIHRGVTFVYDPVTDEYTADPEREGAPETGVRFVLYEIDLSGQPVVEEEIGYADLVDEGDDSVEDIVLHLLVVAHQTTVLDYRVSLDIRPSGGTLGVHGSLQEPDGPRLDFDIEATSTVVGEGDPILDVAFDLRVDARAFSITGTVSGVEDEVEGDGSVELTVRHADDSIRLSVESENGQMDGSVFVNGSLFATVTGDASDPVIASATGEPLTLGELLVLPHIIDGVEDIFDFLEDLLDPVDELVILAIIL